MNYPNPFSEATTIVFNLANTGFTKLEVYDLKGTRIKTLVEQNLDRGDHEIEWRVSEPGVASCGVFLLKLTTATTCMTRKIVLIR